MDAGGTTIPAPAAPGKDAETEAGSRAAHSCRRLTKLLNDLGQLAGAVLAGNFL